MTPNSTKNPPESGAKESPVNGLAFHRENIPDRVMESTNFKQLLYKAKYMWHAIKVPHWKNVRDKKIICFSHLPFLSDLF